MPGNMKIAYMTSNYNWDCYSVLRCGYETLKNRGINVDIFFQKDPIIFQYDRIWIMSTAYYLTDEEYSNFQGKVISFGLSEPCKLRPEKRRNCDVYCTNDLKTSQVLDCYWYPISSDSRYHKSLNLEKKNSILFVGMGCHSVVKNRVQIIEQLRSEGIQVKVFGNNWPKHSDNHQEIRGETLVKEINKSWLMLDIANEDSSLARRILEASACGTAVLAYNRTDVKRLFKEDEEILLYTSWEDLIDKAKRVVSNYQLLERIGQSARLRCLREHDISCRMDLLLQYLENLGIKT